MLRYKNLRAQTVTRCGQEIAAGECYTIQATELDSWRQNEDVFADFAGSYACINDGESDFNATESISLLLGQPLLDAENAQLVRVKYCTSGWHLHTRCLELKTATLNSLINTKATGSVNVAEWQSFDDTTLKVYDCEGNELETQEACAASGVLTCVNFWPTHTFEIIGGEVYQKDRPADYVRGHVIIAPQIPAASGGEHVLVSNMNFEHADSFDIDGRTVKQLQFVPGLPSSEVRIALQHPVGFQHSLLITLELFES